MLADYTHPQLGTQLALMLATMLDALEKTDFIAKGCMR